MGQVLFYHLLQAGLEETLRALLSRALEKGWRVMLRGTDPALLSALDEALWLHPDDGFLPHGLEGGPHDGAQPVLIGRGAAANGAQALLLVDGATASESELRAAERVWLLFDGSDADAVQAARGEWRRLAAAGLATQYWSDEGGRWQMKTERPAAP
jgi:DNA polymerase-3 subunit chi